MDTCLCCTKNLLAASQKVCPLCGHVFKGHGWDGVDAHWKAHHEAEMPYQAFWGGLCEAHRGGTVGASTGAKDRLLEVDDNHREALSRRSSHVENILTHSLIVAIAQELWRRDPWHDLQVFRAEVDDSGFDLVLGCKGGVRNIQVKQTHLQGNAVKYSLRLDFSKMIGGCAIVLVYRAETLEIDHCLFFGGGSGETMPAIEHLPVTLHPGRRNAEGFRKSRENYRDVPRKFFPGPLTIAQLLDRLFPG